MKELYTSPEMKILCFAPAEKLASNNIIDFDDMENSLMPEAPISANDIDVDINIKLN